jgi:hypothetical protein
MWRSSVNSKTLIFAVGILAFVSSLLTSCSKTTDSSALPATALVTVIQASPDEPGVSFYFGAEEVNQAPLDFGHGLDYLKVVSGQRTFEFYAAGTSTIIASGTATFNTNSAYSLFLDNTASKPGIFLLPDTLVAPAGSDASVRFIDLSPDAPAVNLVIQGGKTIASNSIFQGHSSFIPVNGNTTYTFNVVLASTGAVLASLPAVSLSDGTVYTILFEGLYHSTNASDGLNMTLLTNAYFN